MQDASQGNLIRIFWGKGPLLWGKNVYVRTLCDTTHAYV